MIILVQKMGAGSSTPQNGNDTTEQAMKKQADPANMFKFRGGAKKPAAKKTTSKKPAAKKPAAKKKSSKK